MLVQADPRAIVVASSGVLELMFMTKPFGEILFKLEKLPNKIGSYSYKLDILRVEKKSEILNLSKQDEAEIGMLFTQISSDVVNELMNGSELWQLCSQKENYELYLLKERLPADVLKKVRNLKAKIPLFTNTLN